MKTKLFEVRDSMTFIPVMAVQMNVHTMSSTEAFLASRVGFGVEKGQQPLILFGRLDSGELKYSSHEHSSVARTLKVAHEYVAEHWDQLSSGAVIDVQFIEGETDTPKKSEQFASY